MVSDLGFRSLDIFSEPLMHVLWWIPAISYFEAWKNVQQYLPHSPPLTYVQLLPPIADCSILTLYVTQAFQTYFLGQILILFFMVITCIIIPVWISVSLQHGLAILVNLGNIKTMFLFQFVLMGP